LLRASDEDRATAELILELEEGTIKVLEEELYKSSDDEISGSGLVVLLVGDPLLEQELSPNRINPDNKLIKTLKE
jgi:hypothetical protein